MATVPPNEDPFFAVRDDIIDSVTSVQQLYNTYTSHLSTPTLSPSALSTTLDDLDSKLSDISLDLQDLEETIRIVESNPLKYRLDTREIFQRKEFVKKTRALVESMKTTVKTGRQGVVMSTANNNSSINSNSLYSNSNSNSNNLGSQRKSGPPPRAMFTTNNNNNSNNNNNNDFTSFTSTGRAIEREQQQQQLLMRQQDQQLDGVIGTVHNLKGIATTMGRELEDQNALLEDLEMGVDTTAGRMAIAQKKMNEVLAAARADSKSTMAIMCLTIVLIVLLVLIIIS